jgi:superfamily II DNA or RNA helicase
VRWSIDAPSIIAEHLVGVPDALLTALRPGPPAPGCAVAARLARSLSPAEYPVHPPFWLLSEQGLSFRRVLAALYRYHGALLADPVGSGKTFIALAVAAEVNRGSIACLVPASLVPQWRAAAARLSLAVTLCSHEQVSRANLPMGTRGLVIIDESHHFRNPQTRRYRHLAPWLVGRPALFLTATPIVNRVLDLGHQLLLAVRDDALALDGVSSLRIMLRGSQALPALGQLVFQSRAGLESRPRRVQRQSKPQESECLVAAGMIGLVSALQLSRQGAIAGLIRGVLLRAGASSPAALGGALRRYRRLLLHARDAVDTGRVVDRNELKRFTRELNDQLVWWELLPLTEGKSELELSDLPRLEPIIERVDAAAQAGDGKLERLRKLLLDGTPTLVFVGSRDTVRYIRIRLSDLRVAWCTGRQAGIGSTTLSRQTVLAWFREAPQDTMAPVHLVVTDVAAEGLDLQRAARVIHYDLPWTPMRMEQREGRAVRYGSDHSQVEVIRFPLPRVLEHQLRVHSSLARKHKLPAAAGLGSSGRPVWQWRGEAAAKLSGVTAAHGVAGIHSQTEGLLAGIALYRTGEPHPLSATVLWVEPGGDWTEAPDIIAAKLRWTGAASTSGSVLSRSQFVNAWPLPEAAGGWCRSLAPGRARLLYGYRFWCATRLASTMLDSWPIWSELSPSLPVGTPLGKQNWSIGSHRRVTQNFEIWSAIYPGDRLKRGTSRSNSLG